MIRSFLLRTLLFLALISNVAYAQFISGRVLNKESKKPVEYATVSIFESVDSLKIVDGTTSDSAGKFQLRQVKPGNYRILIEAIGFSSETLTRTIGKDISGLTIELNPAHKDLETVVVNSRTSLVDNRIDKLVFNVEKDLTAQGGSASDVLKKVPQVGVDVDGNVTLAGNGGVRFLIDGKPSSAFGSNIADVLAALPASQIKSIEVITSPGARYDAQGMGGIINIILKKSNLRGMNGTLNLSAGTRMESGSLNVNYRNGKFGLNAFASGNFRPRVTTPYSLTRTTHDTSGSQVLQQDGDGSLLRNGMQTGVGFDWSPTTRSTLSGNISFNQFFTDGTGRFSQQQTRYDRTGITRSDYRSETRNASSFSFHDFDASLQYQKKYAREDEELELEASTSLGTRKATSAGAESPLPGGAAFAGSQGQNPGTENESQLQANFSYPVKENVILSVGGKASFTDIQSKSAVSVLQSGSGLYAADARLSNSLDFHQQVYAGYSEINFPVQHLFDVKAGFRYERTERQASYSQAQKPARLPGYNTVVPSIFVMHKFGEAQQLKLSYVRRIERPDYRDLNPFVNTSDPKNLSTGNPLLVPEIGNRIELSYNRDFAKLGTIAATLFVRSNNHDIQPYVSFYDQYAVGDTLYQNVSVSTRENIGTERNIGLNLFFESKSFSGITLRSNVFLFHRRIRNTIDESYSPESFNYRLNLNATWQVSPVWTGEFFGNFNSPRNEVQGRYPSWTTYSFAVRKQLWKKKGSLALTATNPFAQSCRQQTQLSGTSFESTSTRYIPVRSFGINFTWKFGKLEFKKEQKDLTLPEPGA